MIPTPFSLESSLKGPVKDLMVRAKELLQLETLIREFLDPVLKRHCRVAGFKNGDITLLADSPVWATRLRCQVPVLMTLLRRTWPNAELRKMLVKVSPFWLPEKPPRRQLIRSQSAAAVLQEVADTIEDEQLSRTLRRLASRHDKQR